MAGFVLVVGLFLSLAGCGAMAVAELDTYIYLDDFRALCDKFEVDCSEPVELRFKDLEGLVVGRSRPKGKFHTIYFDTDAWHRNSNEGRELTTYHEFGHYFLQAPHGEGIMEPKLINVEQYIRLRESLIEELFNNYLGSENGENNEESVGNDSVGRFGVNGHGGL